MLPKQHRSWLLLAAWFGLSIVTSNAFPTDSVVEDLQNRAVLAPLFSRRNPIEARGDDIPECVPEMVEDNETVEGDGKDIYRSKKEDPDDPPDAPGEFPEKKDRAPVYSDDPEEDKEETQGDSGKTLRARARGSKLRDITVSVMKEGWKKPKSKRILVL